MTTAAAARSNSSDARLLGTAIRLIRRRRGLTTAEAADRMALHERSYENLEAGAVRVSLDHIHRFARAADADPYALIMAVAIGSPGFADRCADNKMMRIFSIALQGFDSRLGDRLGSIDSRRLIEFFADAFDRLERETVERAETARQWMAEGDEALRLRRPDPGR